MIRIGQGEYEGGRLAERGLEIAKIYAEAFNFKTKDLGYYYSGVMFDTSGGIELKFWGRERDDDWSIDVTEKHFSDSDEALRAEFEEAFKLKQIAKNKERIDKLEAEISRATSDASNATSRAARLIEERNKLVAGEPVCTCMRIGQCEACVKENYHPEIN